MIESTEDLMSLTKNKIKEGKTHKVEVVLFTSVRGCGKPGSIVKVARGFARNHLIPRGFADYATASNLQKIEIEKATLAKVDAEHIATAEKLKEQMLGMEVQFYCKVRDRENIYGSIQAKDIVDELRKQNIILNKSQVVLAHSLKVLGKYDVTVTLYGDVDTTISVIIKSSADKPVV